MRIALEASRIELAGGSRFAVMGLIQGILEEDHENQYLVILNREEQRLARFPNARQYIIRGHNRFAARLRAQLNVPRLLRREQVDVVHFVKVLGVFFSPCKSVVTMYDMTTLNYPQFFPRADVAYWRMIQPVFLRSVNKIGALSASTRRDLIKHYNLPPEKIAVIHGACDPSFRRLDSTQIDAIKSRYGLPKDYILTVGNISPKKNYATLVQALRVFKDEHMLPHKLVIVGKEYWSGAQRPLSALIKRLGLENDVVCLGTVTKESLVGLYNAASLFAFPSLDEGFGMVLAEAMACGTPVVASGTSAIPEVVGEAGILLQNPMDARELASAMARVLTEERLRETLVQRGFERVQHFSWRNAGREYIKLYKSLAR
jgi:glycosyltransferase involved in cell wall biosynthesis